MMAFNTMLLVIYIIYISFIYPSIYQLEYKIVLKYVFITKTPFIVLSMFSVWRIILWFALEDFQA